MAPTPDQQVAELVEAYSVPSRRRLKSEAEGDRILERLRMVRGKLSPRSKEAIAQLERFPERTPPGARGAYRRTTRRA